jgi:predicted RNA-binding Zn ribbon-like protein
MPRMATHGETEPAEALIQAPLDDLCLAFANTRFWRGSETPTEQLQGIDALVAWCRSAAGLPGAPFATWLAAWHDVPGDGAAAFKAGIALREAVYGAFHAVAGGKAPDGSDLDAINEAFAAAPPRSGIARAANGFAWRVALPKEPRIAALLAPVAWSAAALLVSPRLAKLRACANERCRWLFLDDSKSGTRRWCAMSSCGNRAKAHRHYLRHKRQ